MLNIEYFLKHIDWTILSWGFSSNIKWEWFDFENVKEYEKHDNIKRINWKLSAKYDTEYTNVYKIEKEPVIDIFLDIDYNFNFFNKEIKNYLLFVNHLIKNLWIKHNIYFVEDKKLKKLNSFQNIPFKKKWDLKTIIESFEFQNKNKYKILISDFVFVDLKNLDKITLYYKKVFSAILPVYDILEKEKKIPLINWFFNIIFMQDFMKQYKEKLDKITKNFKYDFIK